MQDFRDNKKKTIKIGYFGFYFCEICHGLFLGESSHFVLLCMVQLFCFVFELRKYHKISGPSNQRVEYMGIKL